MTRFQVSLKPNTSALPSVTFLIDGDRIETVRNQVGAFVDQRMYTITDIYPLSDPRTPPEQTKDPHMVSVNGREVSA